MPTEGPGSKDTTGRKRCVQCELTPGTCTVHGDSGSTYADRNPNKYVQGRKCGCVGCDPCMHEVCTCSRGSHVNPNCPVHPPSSWTFTYDATGSLAKPHTITTPVPDPTTEPGALRAMREDRDRHAESARVFLKERDDLKRDRDIYAVRFEQMQAQRDDAEARLDAARKNHTEDRSNMLDRIDALHAQTPVAGIERKRRMRLVHVPRCTTKKLERLRTVECEVNGKPFYVILSHSNEPLHRKHEEIAEKEFKRLGLPFIIVNVNGQTTECEVFEVLPDEPLDLVR